MADAVGLNGSRCVSPSCVKPAFTRLLARSMVPACFARTSGHIPTDDSGPLMSARSFIGSVRVALLDDHALVRKGLIAHLEKSPTILVVGSHAGSRSFRAMLATMPVDVALIDYALAMDDIDGEQLIRQLRARHPGMKILVVSAHEESLVIRNLLLAGADGFVAKSQDPDEVIRAIEAVMTGRTYLPPDRAGMAMPAPLTRLSPREWEVIRCFLDGLTVTQIAQKFGRSLKTISAQKSAAFRKLRVSSDVELFKLRNYIISLDGGSRE